LEAWLEADDEAARRAAEVNQESATDFYRDALCEAAQTATRVDMQSGISRRAAAAQLVAHQELNPRRAYEAGLREGELRATCPRCPAMRKERDAAVLALRILIGTVCFAAAAISALTWWYL
jgi:hypothetical protein